MTSVENKIAILEKNTENNENRIAILEKNTKKLGERIEAFEKLFKIDKNVVNYESE